MRVKGIVPVDVADYLLNRKRKDIVDLESRQEVKIDIEADASMIPGENRVICEP